MDAFVNGLFVEEIYSADTSKAPVDDFLFFDDTAEFLKGHRDRVVRYNAISKNLKYDKNIDVSRCVLAD